LQTGGTWQLEKDRQGQPDKDGELDADEDGSKGSGQHEPGVVPGRAEGIERSSDFSQVGLLKPMDIKRIARVPYATVIAWLTVGHPRAGILPSVDLAQTRKRHSFRIRWPDWEAFLAKLQTLPRERQQAKPLPRPSMVKEGNKSMFRY